MSSVLQLKPRFTVSATQQVWFQLPTTNYIKTRHPIIWRRFPWRRGACQAQPAYFKEPKSPPIRRCLLCGLWCGLSRPGREAVILLSFFPPSSHIPSLVVTPAGLTEETGPLSTLDLCIIIFFFISPSLVLPFVSFFLLFFSSLLCFHLLTSGFFLPPFVSPSLHSSLLPHPLTTSDFLSLILYV